MKKIIIIGCGLIGGSFATLAKESKNIIIHGIDKKEKTLKRAKEARIIDTFSLKINQKIVEECDAIFIASPISTVLSIINELNKSTNKCCKIIELSSVKSFLNDPIVTNSHHEIVAAHPMGGSDVQGLENASAKILRNRPMIVFNKDETINKFFKSISFKLVFCNSYEEHDRWMSHISHGPYLAATLIPAILSNESNKYHNELKVVAAGGFKDTTRVTNSPIEWGIDILKGNKSEMIRLIDTLTNELGVLKSAITDSKNDDLRELLTKAKVTRKRIINE